MLGLGWEICFGDLCGNHVEAVDTRPHGGGGNLKEFAGMPRSRREGEEFVALVLTNRGRQYCAGKLSGCPPCPARQGKSSQEAPSLSGYEWPPGTFSERKKVAGKILKAISYV